MASWLDLCCGTGRALIQAATVTERDRLPIEIVGVDLLGMFAENHSRSLTLIEASLSTWSPAKTFDLITVSVRQHQSFQLRRGLDFGCSVR
jgi:ubiquinone/menaquinone biosynthesis C-methylase UbiE